MCNGLVHLHQVGIAHRDIKTDNLLLQSPPTDESFNADHVLISDMGYSKFKENEEVHSCHLSSAGGSPPFSGRTLVQPSTHNI